VRESWRDIFMQTNTLAASFECQDYVELETVDEAFDLWKSGQPFDWCFQLKYDGIWAKCVYENGEVTIWSKTGQLKHSIKIDRLIPRATCVFVGEFMFGSQWSQHPDRQGLVFVFDCLVFDGADVSTLPFRRRLELAEALAVELGGIFRKTNAYNVGKLGEVWGIIERTNSYEGLIVRHKQHTYFNKLYKLKTEIEDDFVILDRYEGTGKYAGMLGGFSVGQVSPCGNLTKVMDVGGGFSDKQRKEYFEIPFMELSRRVVLVKGKARFDSGALRHPCFVRIRDDKDARDCKLKFQCPTNTA